MARARIEQLRPDYYACQNLFELDFIGKIGHSELTLVTQAEQ